MGRVTLCVPCSGERTIPSHVAVRGVTKGAIVANFASEIPPVILRRKSELFSKLRGSLVMSLGAVMFVFFLNTLHELRTEGLGPLVDRVAASMVAPLIFAPFWIPVPAAAGWLIGWLIPKMCSGRKRFRALCIGGGIGLFLALLLSSALVWTDGFVQKRNGIIREFGQPFDLRDEAQYRFWLWKRFESQSPPVGTYWVFWMAVWALCECEQKPRFRYSRLQSLPRST